MSTTDLHTAQMIITVVVAAISVAVVGACLVLAWINRSAGLAAITALAFVWIGITAARVIAQVWGVI